MGKLPAWAQKECGGSVNGRRDAGGKVMKRDASGWTGEGDSGKGLREKAKAVRDEPALTKGIIASNLATIAGTAIRPGGLLRTAAGATLPATGLAYLGKKAYDSFTQDSRADKIDREADEAEGRKSGGSVKKGKR